MSYICPKKCPKVAEKFSCFFCDYVTSKKSDYSKHILTLKHKNLQQILFFSKKSPEIYECKTCDYITSNKTNFNKHCLTRKHSNLQQILFSSQKYEKNSPMQYCCEMCGYSSLYKKDYNKHILTKKHADNLMQLELDDPVESENMSVGNNKISVNEDVFIELIRDSKEFKELLYDQTNEFKKLIMEQHNKIIKLEQMTNTNTTINAMHNNANNSHTNIIHNTITNHNTFNLQFFLNEQCKDALNMIDFINSLEFGPDSVEYTGRNGYVQGITKIILDGLKELDIYKRPIHCTDLKRETLYIKENRIWEKDTDEKQIFQKAIGEVVRKNMQQIRNWRVINPNCEIMETPEYEFHLVVMQQCIGGGSGHQEPNNKKIIKNIAKYVLVDKTI